MMFGLKCVLLGQTFPMGYQAPETKIVYKSNTPEKLMYQLTTSGPTNLLVFNILGLYLWMFRVLSLMICVKNYYRSLCNQLLMNDPNRHISFFKERIQPFQLVCMLCILHSFVFHSLIESNLTILLCFLQYLCLFPCYISAFISFSIQSKSS